MSSLVIVAASVFRDIMRIIIQTHKRRLKPYPRDCSLSG